MKKITATATLAIGIMILSLSNVNAINLTFMAGEVLIQQVSLVSFEKNISVQDWMLNFEDHQAFTKDVSEKKIKLESWMINTNWIDTNEQATLETEIELEDWMTRPFTKEDNRNLALNVLLK